VKALERGGEVIRVTIPDPSRDLLDRQAAPLDESRGLFHPHPSQVFHGRGAEGRFEAPAKVTGAEPHRVGQRWGRVGLIKAVFQELAGLAERAAVGRYLAQQNRDPRLHLEDIEWLVHVVINPGPQRPQEDLLRAVAGQHRDRAIPSGPELPEGLQAVAGLQAHVQQQQVDRVAAKERQPFPFVGRHVHLIAMVFQGCDDRLCDVWIVIDDQDLPRSPRTHHDRTVFPSLSSPLNLCFSPQGRRLRPEGSARKVRMKGSRRGMCL